MSRTHTSAGVPPPWLDVLGCVQASDGSESMHLVHRRYGQWRLSTGSDDTAVNVINWRFLTEKPAFAGGNA